MVNPKKHLGQHFLQNDEICAQVCNAVSSSKVIRKALEIGPGTGALTKHLLLRKDLDLDLVEVDRESVAYLKKHFTQLKGHIHERDFLQMPLDELFEAPLIVVGNFPYNISSQILFKVLEHRDLVSEVVGMFQKEVAERVVAGAGKRDQGILSVLLQAFYHGEYLFTVNPEEFFPAPKVKSGVIRLWRNDVKALACDEVFFKKLVKTGFNQRRKTLRNSIKSLLLPGVEVPWLDQRPEQLSVDQWIHMSQLLQKSNIGMEDTK